MKIQIYEIESVSHIRPGARLVYAQIRISVIPFLLLYFSCFNWSLARLALVNIFAILDIFCFSQVLAHKFCCCACMEMCFYNRFN